MTVGDVTAFVSWVWLHRTSWRQTLVNRTSETKTRHLKLHHQLMNTSIPQWSLFTTVYKYIAVSPTVSQYHK